MRSLNLGCGQAKFENCDNVDFNPEFNAELKFDIREKFPIDDSTYDEVYLFHIIEHIEKRFHGKIFKEIHRVMKEDGILYMSFPEFKLIAQNWLDNYKGQREFWEWTIYGRQNSTYDYHVCAMMTGEVVALLQEIGFKNIVASGEPAEPYNTIIKCAKSLPMVTYETVLQNDINKVKV